MSTSPEIDYPRDIWEYLGDIPRMPHRSDRDALVSSLEAAKRVKLWDFFFPFSFEEIGKAPRAEQAKIAKELAESHARSAASQERASMRRANLAAEAGRIDQEEADLAIKIGAEAKSSSLIGRILLWLAAIVLLVPTILTAACGSACGVAGIGAGSAVGRNNGGEQGAAAGLTVAGAMFGMALAMSVPSILIVCVSALPWFGARSIADRRLLSRRKEFGDRRRKNAEAVVRVGTDLAAEEEAESIIQGRIVARDRYIKDLLRCLSEQVPVQPDPNQVYEWFLEDLARLATETVDRAGLGEIKHLKKLRERNGVGQANPVRIHAPSSIQEASGLPAQYQADHGPVDLIKHMNAWRVERLSSGKVADFHAVVFVTFFTLGPDIFDVHMVHHDFVRNVSGGDRATRQRYEDGVVIGSGKRSTRIGGADGKAVFLEDLPYIRVGLHGGFALELSAPDRKYLQVLDERLTSLDEWAFDPRESMEAALLNLRWLVDEARGKMLARLRREGTPDEDSEP